MIKINNIYFLEYLIDELKRNEFKEVLILTGYKNHIIENYFKNGSDHEIKISYDFQPSECDTGLRLKMAFNKLHDYFFLQYCDNYIPFNINAMIESFNNLKKDLMISIYDNLDNYTKNNVFYNNGKYLETYDKKRKLSNLNGVDIGFLLMKKEVIDLLPQSNINFESHIYPKLIKKKKISCYIFRHRYYSVGSFDRLEKTAKFFKNRNRYVFLDRDGVINVKLNKAQYVTKWSEWEWMPNVLENLKKLNDKGYKVIIITNQAGISRMKLTIKDLNEIHSIMKAEIIHNGGSIQDIFVCPHHWDEDCDCRKPKAGMFFSAQKKYDIDLSRTYYIGDDERDREASINAGCKFIKVETDKCFGNFLKNFLNE